MLWRNHVLWSKIMATSRRKFCIHRHFRNWENVLYSLPSKHKGLIIYTAHLIRTDQKWSSLKIFKVSSLVAGFNYLVLCVFFFPAGKILTNTTTWDWYKGKKKLLWDNSARAFQLTHFLLWHTSRVGIEQICGEVFSFHFFF